MATDRPGRNARGESGQVSIAEALANNEAAAVEGPLRSVYELDTGQASPSSPTATTLTGIRILQAVVVLLLVTLKAMVGYSSADAIVVDAQALPVHVTHLGEVHHQEEDDLLVGPDRAAWGSHAQSAIEGPAFEHTALAIAPGYSFGVRKGEDAGAPDGGWCLPEVQ